MAGDPYEVGQRSLVATPTGKRLGVLMDNVCYPRQSQSLPVIGRGGESTLLAPPVDWNLIQLPRLARRDTDSRGGVGRR